jgi:DNA replication protein DnaC
MEKITKKLVLELLRDVRIKKKFELRSIHPISKADSKARFLREVEKLNLLMIDDIEKLINERFED